MVRSEAHHRDYSKPLEVEWLCRPCHDDEHRHERQAARAKRQAEKLLARPKPIRSARRTVPGDPISPVKDGRPFVWRGRLRT